MCYDVVIVHGVVVGMTVSVIQLITYGDKLCY